MQHVRCYRAVFNLVCLAHFSPRGKVEFNSSHKQDMSMLGISNHADSVSLWPPVSVVIDEEVGKRFDCVMSERMLKWVVRPN